MRDFFVYLAGPITGLTFDGCTDWRDYAKRQLRVKVSTTDHIIYGVSPMRWKEDLRNEPGLVIMDSYEHTLLSSQRGITARDQFDTFRADMLLVNMLGAERASIGTVLEIGWATALNKRVVLVMEKEGNLHDHAMIRELCPFRVDNLDEGIDLVGKLLLP